MPRNSPTGFITAFFATITGFALIWHIWWLVALGLRRRLRGVSCGSPGATSRNTSIPGAGGRARSIASAGESARSGSSACTAEGRRHERDRDDSPLARAGDPYRRRRGPQWAGAGHGRIGAIMRPATAKAVRPRKRIIVGYGFWIFLLSDIVMFSVFFAAYAVLQTATAGGPPGRELFDLRQHRASRPRACSLSSFTCGLSASWRPARAASSGPRSALLITGLLGLAFLVLEVREFASWSPQARTRSAARFLSSFFALVGLHGLHVTAGLLWLGTMMAQVFVKGFRPEFVRRLLCFNLFWHALDIIWVGFFTIVYLIGVGR